MQEKLCIDRRHLTSDRFPSPIDGWTKAVRTGSPHVIVVDMQECPDAVWLRKRHLDFHLGFVSLCHVGAHHELASVGRAFANAKQVLFRANEQVTLRNGHRCLTFFVDTIAGENFEVGSSFDHHRLTIGFG